MAGATSDLGRNLIECLLRSFKDVKIRAIVRSKDGEKGADRLKKIFKTRG